LGARFPTIGFSRSSVRVGWEMSTRRGYRAPPSGGFEGPSACAFGERGAPFAVQTRGDRACRAHHPISSPYTPSKRPKGSTSSPRSGSGGRLSSELVPRKGLSLGQVSSRLRFLSPWRWPQPTTRGSLHRDSSPIILMLSERGGQDSSLGLAKLKPRQGLPELSELTTESEPRKVRIIGRWPTCLRAGRGEGSRFSLEYSPWHRSL